MFGLDGIDHLGVSRIAGRLIGQKETIAISESSAGGLISAALLSVPGASAYFLGGGVIYTRKSMAALLDLTPDKLDGIRSATEPMAWASHVGLDPTFVSPAAIWISRAAIGLSCPARSGRRD